MAYLKTRDTRHDADDRLRWKTKLVRLLFERRYSRDEVVALFRLIDWMLHLPEKQAIIFDADLESLEEEYHMPYLSSMERRALQRGIEQGLEARPRFGDACSSCAPCSSTASGRCPSGPCSDWAKRRPACSTIGRSGCSTPRGSKTSSPDLDVQVAPSASKARFSRISRPGLSALAATIRARARRWAWMVRQGGGIRKATAPPSLSGRRKSPRGPHRNEGRAIVSEVKARRSRAASASRFDAAEEDLRGDVGPQGGDRQEMAGSLLAGDLGDRDHGVVVDLAHQGLGVLTLIGVPSAQKTWSTRSASLASPRRR